MVVWTVYTISAFMSYFALKKGLYYNTAETVYSYGRKI